MVAYACRISRENMKAIASENPKFDIEYTLAWLDKHGSGYFLRDESSVFDCYYFADPVFLMMYKFESSDTGDVFRRVIEL